MGVIIRTRIDDGDLAFSDDVGSAAGIGERAWIIGDDAPDAGRDNVSDAMGEVDILDEGDRSQIAAYCASLASIAPAKASARARMAVSLSWPRMAAGGPISVLLASTM